MTDRLPCPHCGAMIGDLWEYFRHSDDEGVESECDECERPVFIGQHVSVRYSIEKAEAKGGEP